jgi:hypothetical protein
MGYLPASVLNQVIATLGLAVRDSSGLPTYGSSLGDQTYAIDELQRGVDSAGTMIMEAICQTEGHEHRGVFTNQTSLTHGAALPAHYGPIAVPDITPYSGAAYTIKGKVKSVEEIISYRNNINNRYSETAHNIAGSGNHSKLAGFYAIDNDMIFFTGFSATALVTNFDETDAPLLPDSYHPLGIALAIANLKKDGDLSDIFSYYEQQGMAGLALIRGQKKGQPSLQKTIGTRDGGDK